ncbi:hypothetical protein OG555_34115 [Kribbella sp. NBC_01484]|uniref:DUF308 domain-containing protein n=1 Tax=Kribbella sp. NBC_01484 TaxID=2903579 RepID=UPI002E322D2D|nr:DUF308 domain-containing protein [Kribbella sp. NBC_01484]
MWPDITLYVVSILVAWYLIVYGTIHIVSALVSLVGMWAICRWVSEIFAGFTLCHGGKQADRLVA